VNKRAKFIKMVQRGGHDAMYFEHDLYSENSTELKIKQLLKRLYEKKLNSILNN
jgi:hypothetical protein